MHQVDLQLRAPVAGNDTCDLVAAGTQIGTCCNGVSEYFSLRKGTCPDARTFGRSDVRTLGRSDARTPGPPGVRTPGRSDTFLPLIFNFCVRRGGGPKPGRAVTSRAAPAPAATNAKIAKNERKERTIMKSTMYEKYGNVTLVRHFLFLVRFFAISAAAMAGAPHLPPPLPSSWPESRGGPHGGGRKNYQK